MNIAGAFSAASGRIRPLFLVVAIMLVSGSALAQPGTVDPSFDAGTGLGSSQSIFTATEQADGKLLIGGSFDFFSGVSNRLIRLNRDGSVDMTFNFSGISGSPYYQSPPFIDTIVIQSDGRVVIGGAFLSPRQHVARFNSDGTPDAFFNSGQGLSGPVNQIALQPDGKILAAGDSFLKRLNPDGSLDSAFTPGVATDDSVFSVSLQSDGKIIIGGSFNYLNGYNRPFIARVYSDGNLDRSFDVGLGPDARVRSVVVLDDGRILAGGSFTNFNGIRNPSLLRLLPDGGLDMSFSLDASLYPPSVQKWVIEGDRKIVVVGPSPPLVVRLLPDGNSDPDFRFGGTLVGSPNGVTGLRDGSVVIFGPFSQPRNWIARLFGGPLSPPMIQVQPASQSFVAGRPVHLSVTASALPAPSYQWQKDGQDLVGATNGVLWLPRVLSSDAGSYIAVVTNNLGRAVSDPAVLTVNPAPENPGALDISFHAPPEIGSGVRALAVLEDGRVLAGGTFTNANGLPKLRLARLQADGRLDSTFDPGSGPNQSVNTLLLLPNGLTSLAGGAFSTFNGAGHVALAKLDSIGMLDTNFHYPIFSPPGSSVSTLLRQPDGRIILTGTFTNIGGVRGYHVARLQVDGAFDNSFSNSVSSGGMAVLQPNGRIVVSSGSVMRLLPSGAMDPSFTWLISGDGFLAMALQPDGKVVLGGRGFTTPGKLLRLNADGQRDTNFAPVLAGSLDNGDSRVTAIVVQGDGRIVVGGDFTTANGIPRRGVARFYADGSLDTGFDPGLGVDLPALVMALQGNGDILLSGQFLTFDGVEVRGFARFHGGPFSAPTIIKQPTDLTVDFGAEAVIQMVALGFPAPNYQWSSNNVALSGATNAAFVIPTANTNHTASYSAVASNAFGVVTSAVARLTVTTIPPSILSHKTNMTVLAGITTNISVVATSLPPPTYQWFLNGSLISGATNSKLSFSNIHETNAGDYSVTVSNLVGVVTGEIAAITVVPAPTNTGALNIDFYPGASANSIVWDVGFHLDGVLVTGWFTTFSGVSRAGFARLHPDGSLDLNFVVPTVGGDVTAFKVAKDGSIVVGGSFTNIGGVQRNYLARLRQDGTIEPSFDPGTGPDGAVSAIRLLPDDRIMIGGTFGRVNGTSRAGLARLFSSGLLDKTFVPAPGVSGLMALQGDGKVISTLSSRITRLNSDGSLDLSFASTNFTGGAIFGAELEPDGRIIVRGSFTSPRNSLARLLPDGSIDDAFNPGAPVSGSISAAVSQGDGKILVGGSFVGLGGNAANALIRLTAAGARDLGFPTNSGVSGGMNFPSVNAIAVREDGDILLGGDFSQVNGIPRRNVALLRGGPLSSPVFAVQPSNQVASAGQPLSFYAGVFGLPKVSYQWQVNGTILSGETNAWLTIGSARLGDAGNYSVIASNTAGMITSTVVTVTIARQAIGTGIADAGFYTGLGPEDWVLAMVAQPDGKVLIGGGFATIDFQSRRGIARLLADGNLDRSFDPGAGANGSSVRAIVLQPDGRIVIGGGFTNYNGQTRHGIARLLADGSLDGTFGGTVEAGQFGGTINSLLLQPDGKIILGGSFTTVSAGPRTNLARLNIDGTMDASFNYGLGPNGPIQSILAQLDGLVVLGQFTRYDNHVTRWVAKLDRDGVVDPNFTSFGPSLPPTYDQICWPFPQGALNNIPFIFSAAAQPDGRIVLGGVFTSYGGISRNHLVRLNSNGSVDFSFLPVPGPDALVSSVALQADGRILIGGCFSTVNGLFRHRLSRLNPDGSVDTTFDPGIGVTGGASPPISVITTDSSGRVLVGGSFTGVGGIPRRNVARLQGDVALFNVASQSNTFSASIASVEGHNYFIEFKDRLDAANWTSYLPVAGSGDVLRLTDPTPPAHQRFYRLRIE